MKGNQDLGSDSCIPPGPASAQEEDMLILVTSDMIDLDLTSLVGFFWGSTVMLSVSISPVLIQRKCDIDFKFSVY